MQHIDNTFSRKFPFLVEETPVIHERCLYIYISSLNESKFSSVWPDQLREERVEWHRMCCAGACNKNILNVMGVHCLELTRNQSNCQRATCCVYIRYPRKTQGFVDSSKTNYIITRLHCRLYSKNNTADLRPEGTYVCRIIFLTHYYRDSSYVLLYWKTDWYTTMLNCAWMF